MNTGNTIKKILFIAIWIAIGAGMITLLAAAIRKQKSERCTDYKITIKGKHNEFFIGANDITKILSESSNGEIKGRQVANIDLMKMERMLEKYVWIRDAELYFDNKNVLHITVTQREPVARIYTNTGRAFYIDADEKQIPLSARRSARVLVFTGFPAKKIVSNRDKELLHDIRTTAEFINNHPFWNAQVSQVDITEEREFEMVPVVGNHVVRFGSATDVELKFQRLFVFYKQVLSKTNFDKYKTIDIRYKGQVIGVKGIISKVDSVQLRRNVEKLLKLARDMQNDSLINNIPVIANRDPRDPPATSLNKPNLPDQQAKNPDPVKPFLEPDRGEKKPKAIMSGKNEK